MKYRKTLAVVIAISFACFSLITACNKTDATITTDATGVLNLPATPYNYSNIALPAYFLTPPINGQINTPANNAITDNGATLGRVLFYDKNLSINNSIACASCHIQQFGFSDSSVLSKGFAGGVTSRNSMSLIDAKYYPDGKFFWDERAVTLEAQTLQPIQNHVEMGMTLDSLTKKLNTLSYYPSLFQNAFGDKTITSGRISLALSQFIRSIISFQSKYDEGRQTIAANTNPGALDFTNFTVVENRGKQLFFSPVLACAACHGTETFTAAAPKNNGLDLVTVDSGVGAITKNNADNGLFKITSLRNVELSAPYMHDGRFKTLDAVIEHYNSGIQPTINLSAELKTPAGTPKRLNLPPQDKAALVAFLKTLTDKKVTADVKYSSPFN